MTPERLLALYDRVADAPDAIQRLRRFVLDLAVRGKLVEQDPNDEPASELLKRITAEKARLVNAGEIRKGPSLPPISRNELPYELPNGWAWTRLGELIHLVSGQHLQPQEYSDDPKIGLPYITGPSDFAAEGLRISRFALVRKAVAKKGHLLLTVKGSGVGKTTICDLPEVAISRQLMGLTAIEWDDRFLLLITHRLAEKLQEEARSLIPGISREDVDAFVFPLPPLAEQHRIVAKVDELMALLDRLAAARAARETVRDRLTTASLARLNAPDPATFQAHARFTLANLHPLTTRPDQIKPLRQTILNLAVRGKLVEQDPNDEPAGSFFDRLSAEKVEQLRQRSIRADKPLATVYSDEAPFSVPSSWKWVRAQDISLKISDGVHKKPHYIATGIPFITVKNLTEGPGISFRETKFISADDHREFIKRTHPERGDLLITKDGTIGVTRVIDTDADFSIFVSVALLKMVDPRIAWFLSLCLNSELVQAQIIPKGAALKHLHLVDLRKLPIPLPPLAEQHRIVAEVDALMALLDRLEASLAAADTTRRRLLEALLHEALAPAMGSTLHSLEGIRADDAA
jgi:type I restriction enzyme S subunit